MPTPPRLLLLLIATLVLVAAVAAAPVLDPSATAPPAAVKAPAALKSAPTGQPPRQGGDTVADAVAISIPAHDVTGTTAGYIDDYDEVCPYSNSTSPDVVYTFTPDQTTSVDIDMLGSTYDTKIYVYDDGGGLVACNDDFYPDYVSKLENVMVMGGQPYYLVIDGYGGDFGSYVLAITEFEPCSLSIPVYVEEEMEPPLTDGYQDAFNGGCNSPEFGNPFQPGWYGGFFHGRTGWYRNGGVDTRDTDWFELTVEYGGYLEIVGNAEHPCYMFELGPQDCGSVSVIQNVTIGPCQEGSIVIPGPTGSTVWFWVGPTAYSPPDGFIGYEFDYLLYMEGGSVTTESRTWTSVRDLYR